MTRDNNTTKVYQFLTVEARTYKSVELPYETRLGFGLSVNKIPETGTYRKVNANKVRDASRAH